MGSSLKLFLLKKILAGSVNNAQDPLFFNKMLERTENVHSKCTLTIELIA